ncbi:sphingolipid 8-(E)-desaturase [Geosmithia morbida]|uniref:Delta 8-(E)-sphingolipid desaturase n=1 Tax=Geosmithia morbida TaxID=1094350 RepID=A0A9P4YR41_9HYPO|nr:sphingolipid 8-(E)-desaturase [Geosmithia morbida]KAF4121568.1 sphingolipid 8-(E)-desaturase [Geosmithia morbida]
MTTTPAAGGKPQRTYPLMSREDVEALIAEGRKIIIFDGHVLRVDGWIKFHPGGDKAILHMVGKDATDEMVALHSYEATEQMARYRIGRIEGYWKNFLPPIQGGTFRSRAELSEQDEETDSAHEVDTASSADSRAPSPVFDKVAGGMRKRTATTTTVTTCLEEGRPKPSVEAAATDIEDDGMTFLDTLTRERITLDLNKYPAQDPETQGEVMSKYRELHQRIRDAGLYDCNYWAYAVECSRYLALAITSLVCLRAGWYMTSAFALGGLWHQLVFTAHDAGHIGITHNFQVDSVIGIIIADFIGGLSMGWWKSSHNVHHIVTNAPEHDPDIEHLPFFAISHRFLTNLKSTYYDRLMAYDAVAKVMLRVQSWTYYPILSLARFNLYVLSWDYLLAGRGPRKGVAAWFRWLELTGQVFFYIWYGYLVIYKSLPDGWTRFGYIMISNMTASPLHVQIVLSHFAMSTADLGPQESFPQRMLRTTMDVDCPPWLDFIHGGLQFQAIHHLFPRVPRHNLRRMQSMVQEFCNDVGIPYALYGFTDGNKQVIGRLSEVSRQAAILAKCQKAVSQSGDIFGHGH